MSLIARLKELQSEQGTDLNEMRKLNELAAAEKRSLNADEKTKLEKMDTAFEERSKTIENIQGLIEKERRNASLVIEKGEAAPGDGEQRSSGAKEVEYRTALNKWIRGGMGDLKPEERSKLIAPHMSEVERRSMITSNAASAGFLINDVYGTELINVMKHYGGMFTAVGTIPNEKGEMVPNVLRTATGATWSTPRYDDTAVLGARIGEATAVPFADVAGDRFTLESYIYHSNAIKFSYAQLQDDGYNFVGNITRISGDRIGRKANIDFTVGTGSSQPTGVTVAATDSGVTTVVDTITYDKMIDLQMSIDEAYEPNAKWMFTKGTLKLLRYLKDSTGMPLWEPSLKMGVPNMFMGKEYVINNDMPTLSTADNRGILYGDFSYYTIRMVQDLMVVRSDQRWVDTLEVGFIGHQRMDGGLSVPAAVKYLKAVAS